MKRNDDEKEKRRSKSRYEKNLAEKSLKSRKEFKEVEKTSTFRF
jgi:hypothetical protein